MQAGGEQSSTRISGYEYDEVSNRKKLTTESYNGLGSAAQLVSTSVTGYTYNAADELTDEITTSGASSSTKTYNYDDNGAQIGVTSNGIVTPYKYDFEGKLVAVGDGTSSTRSSYVYDGEGNRLSSIVASGTNVKTTQFLNDTNTAYVQVLEERDENGVLQARYDYGDGDLQKLLRLNKANNTYQSRWFLNDGLDSTRQLVDDSGAVTDSYAYDAFGNTAQRAGDTENSRLYNGQQQDETGLYFLRARYMNTQTGRFLSHDPLMGGADDPTTLHRYLYAGGDPVNATDPSGKFTLTSTLVTVGVMVYTAGIYTAAIMRSTASDNGQLQVPGPNETGLITDVQSVTFKTSKSADDFFPSMQRLEGFPYPYSSNGVSGVGDEITWDWGYNFQALGQADFRTRCTLFDADKHFFVNATLSGHPLRGHRYFWVNDNGDGTITLETGAVEKPNRPNDAAKIAIGGRYVMRQGWETMLNTVMTKGDPSAKNNVVRDHANDPDYIWDYALPEKKALIEHGP